MRLDRATKPVDCHFRRLVSTVGVKQFAMLRAAAAIALAAKLSLLILPPWARAVWLWMREAALDVIYRIFPRAFISYLSFIRDDHRREM